MHTSLLLRKYSIVAAPACCSISIEQTNKHTTNKHTHNLFGRVGRKEGLPQPLPQRTHYSVMGLGGRMSSFQHFVRPHLVDSLVFPRKDGKPPTRVGNLQQTYLQNLSLPKYRVFSNPPPHPSPGSTLKEGESTFP